MNIHTGSVVKAGGIAAGVAVLLGIFGFVAAYVPVLACLLAPLLCLGWILVPAGAGLGYGYFAPGKETLGQSAVGGALAGGFSGLVYGIISGIMTAVTGVTATSALQDADLVATGISTGAGLAVSICCPVLFGLVLGAIGGVIWPLVQGNRA